MSVAVINAKVNQFPSLTWHHLKINNTTLDFKVSTPEKALIEGNGDRVTLNQKLFNDFYGNEHIATGLGKDFDQQYDQIVKDNSFAINEFTVQDGCVVNTPVHITFSPGDKSESSSDNVIIAGASSESTFIFFYNNKKSSEGFFGNRIRVFAHENAVVHVVVVNLLGDGYTVFNSIGGISEDNANIDVTEIHLGGNRVYTGTCIDLNGYQAKFTGAASYCVVKDHFLDFNQIVNHYGRETVSKFTVDGVVMDSGTKTWRGTINFKNGCIDAKGDEEENVLLLSPEVENRSLPVILCDEEQVEGRHGCSIGKLDSDKMFYMQSRGVDEKTAQELITKAKVSSVCRLIPSETVKQAVQDYVEDIFAK